jgi:hypothetical protein
VTARTDSKNPYNACLFLAFQRHEFCTYARRVGGFRVQRRSGRIVLLMLAPNPTVIGRGRTMNRAMDNAVRRIKAYAAQKRAHKQGLLFTEAGA